MQTTSTGNMALRLNIAGEIYRSEFLGQAGHRQMKKLK
jgi:hypothetical protein